MVGTAVAIMVGALPEELLEHGARRMIERSERSEEKRHL